jgi:hypothetical protein
MAFQINGQTVINNSRVASSMTGVAPLAHDEDAWNNAFYLFGTTTYVPGEVNFVTQAIQPNNFIDFNDLFINIRSNLISGGGGTFSSDVTMRLDGNTGSYTWTIIPSSHTWAARSMCVIAMRKSDNRLLIETWLTPSNYDADSNYPKELNLQDARWVNTDNVFDTASESFNAIVIDWPSFGAASNRLVHEVHWR